MKRYSVAYSKTGVFENSFWNDIVYVDIESKDESYIISLDFFEGKAKRVKKDKILDENGVTIGIIKTSNLKDFLCIGGKFDGLRKDYIDVDGCGYIMYNASSFSRDRKNAAVFIHKDFLKEKNES